jgi:hypothetical protein
MLEQQPAQEDVAAADPLQQGELGHLFQVAFQVSGHAHARGERGAKSRGIHASFSNMAFASRRSGLSKPPLNQA